jgi:hypothetical protein
MGSKMRDDQPPELRAVGVIYTALIDLEPPVQIRALRYAAEMLGLSLGDHEGKYTQGDGGDAPESRNGEARGGDAPPVLPPSQDTNDAEGVNAVALRWLKRSDIELSKLQRLFSLGIEEIDLVARKVPGISKRERLRNVILLKGVAAYLSAGTPRISSDQLKEASLHYNAYDVANHARYLKEFAADVGGTKEAGYTLTARGLTAATELLKELLSSNQK